MKKYPFKFLDAYTREDRDIFFGRDQEIDELYRMVFQTNLLLVYGASGTGKTSIIRCGLANRFKASQWLDLYIRRGENINQSLLESIEKNIPEMAQMAPEAGEMDWFEAMVDTASKPDYPELSAIDSDHPVAQALRTLYLASFTPVYLIFDQFEELYTLGGEAEQEAFTETIVELVRLPLPVKVILVMREEYLAKLYELEMAVPQLRHKKLRIEPMDLPRVEEVILHATLHNEHSNISLNKGEEREIARAIIEKIREGDVNIKLPYLQVFMDRLYELATGEAVAREKPANLSLDLVHQAGFIGGVLADFIERQNQLIYQQLSNTYGQLPEDIVWRLLSPFATVDGTKVPIQQSDLKRLQKLLPETIQTSGKAFIKTAIAALENARILRFRKEEQTYEVAHDTLAQQIAEKRSEEEKTWLKVKRMLSQGMATYGDTKTLLSKQQLAFIQPYEARLMTDLSPAQINFLQESRKKRQRQLRQTQLGILLAFGIAILVILIVWREQQKTQSALNDLLAAQAAREKTELRVLLQQAGQIAKGENCPPQEMRQTIDSLHQKHQQELNLQELYRHTIENLQHCE